MSTTRFASDSACTDWVCQPLPVTRTAPLLITILCLCAVLYDSEQLNKQLNLISKQISDLRKKERQRPGDAAAGGGQPVTPSPVATGITSHSGRESPAAADSVDDLVSKSKGIKTLIAEARASEAEVLAKRDETLAKIGNLVHEEVPKDKDEVGDG